MIAVDTNILVRLLTEDDRDQADRAERLVTGQPVLIPKTVLLETEWVLRSSYRLSSGATCRAVEKLLGLPTVSVEDQRAVARALSWHAAGFDFADALHLASSAEADSFVTFDEKLQRMAGAAGVRPPVILPE